MHVCCFIGDPASNDEKMIQLLHEKWENHNAKDQSRINRADQWILCLAHIIHNAVLDLLRKLNASPEEQSDRPNNEGVSGLYSQYVAQGPLQDCSGLRTQTIDSI